MVTLVGTDSNHSSSPLFIYRLINFFSFDFPLSEQRNERVSELQLVRCHSKAKLNGNCLLPDDMVGFTIKGLVMTSINFCLFVVPSGYVDQTTKAAIVNAAYFKVNPA